GVPQTGLGLEHPGAHGAHLRRGPTARTPDRLDRMRPLDPRLLRYARSARGYVLLTTGFGVVTAALVVCQALLLAHALGGAVHDGATLAALGPTIGWLAVVVVARVLVTTGQERFAHRAATATI